ncbi:MAG: hypothetical protein Q8Q39_05565 [bacterium]|nr:hypothetical protein [bacterium]
MATICNDNDGACELNEVETCAFEMALCENRMAERMALPNLPNTARKVFEIYRRTINEVFENSPRNQRPTCFIITKQFGGAVLRSYMQYEAARLGAIAPVVRLSCGHSVREHFEALKGALELFPKETVH